MWLAILSILVINTRAHAQCFSGFTQKVKMTSLDSKTVQVDLVVFARVVQKCSYLDILNC